jgi:hypothetical protein
MCFFVATALVLEVGTEKLSKSKLNTSDGQLKSFSIAASYVASPSSKFVGPTEYDGPST